jgi:hypothetical protein
LERKLGLEPDAGAIDHDFIMPVTRPNGQDFTGQSHMAAHVQIIHLLAIFATRARFTMIYLREFQYCVHIALQQQGKPAGR